jgi:hypothetical protein
MQNFDFWDLCNYLRRLFKHKNSISSFAIKSARDNIPGPETERGFMSDVSGNFVVSHAKCLQQTFT